MFSYGEYYVNHYNPLKKPHYLIHENVHNIQKTALANMHQTTKQLRKYKLRHSRKSHEDYIVNLFNFTIFSYCVTFHYQYISIKFCFQ